LTNAISLLM